MQEWTTVKFWHFPWYKSQTIKPSENAHFSPYISDLNLILYIIFVDKWIFLNLFIFCEIVKCFQYLIMILKILEKLSYFCMFLALKIDILKLYQ